MNLANALLGRVLSWVAGMGKGMMVFAIVLVVMFDFLGKVFGFPIDEGALARMTAQYVVLFGVIGVGSEIALRIFFAPVAAKKKSGT